MRFQTFCQLLSLSSSFSDLEHALHFAPHAQHVHWNSAPLRSFYEHSCDVQLSFDTNRAQEHCLRQETGTQALLLTISITLQHRESAAAATERCVRNLVGFFRQCKSLLIAPVQPTHKLGDLEYLGAMSLS